jgi:hypothetical protein
MNESETGSISDPELTQAGSRSVPVTGDLKRMRTRYGYDSPIGRRCSNILEIMDGMPRPPEEWIDYLMPDWVPEKYAKNCRSIEVQAADLRQLLSQPR